MSGNGKHKQFNIDAAKNPSGHEAELLLTVVRDGANERTKFKKGIMFNWIGNKKEADALKSGTIGDRPQI